MQHQSAEFNVRLSLDKNGRRRTACISGYRPNHKHPVTGEYFMGAFYFDGALMPGETLVATLQVLCSAEQLESLVQSKTWTIWEGPHYIGNVEIIERGSSVIVKS